MTNTYLEEHLQIPGITLTEREAKVGDATFRVQAIPSDDMINAGVWTVIDPFKTSAQLRKITAYDARDLTIAALENVVNPATPIFYGAKPVVNVKWWAAKHDGSSSDQDAFQNCHDQVLNVGGGGVYVPQCDVDNGEFYKVTEPIKWKSKVNLFGDGPGSHIKNTSTSAPAGYGGTAGYYPNVLSVGNYGGETNNTQGALFALTYYGINAANQGTTTITFDTAGESANFTAGDIVFIKSSTTFTDTVDGESIPLYVMTNKVLSVGSGTLELVYPLNHDFDAGASIATAAETFTGLDGDDSYIAEDVTIRDLKLESALTDNWSVIHASVFNATFENLTLVGDKVGLGVNPCGFSRFRNIEVRGIDASSDRPIEIVHLTNNTVIEDITIPKGIFSVTECGSHVVAERVWIGHGRVAASRKHDLTLRDITVEKCSDAGTAGAVAFFGKDTENCLADNLKLRNISAGIIGFQIPTSTKGHKLLNSEINAASDTAAVIIKSGAVDYQVRGNTIGIDGSRTLEDYIEDENKMDSGVIKDNRSVTTRHNVANATFISYQTAAENTQRTYTVPANSFRTDNALKITAWGDVNGTNDTKTIRIKEDATPGTILTISYAAGETGIWRIELILFCGSFDPDSADSSLKGTYVTHEQDGGAIAAGSYNQTTADLYSADWDITLTFELANASDEITLLGWFVEQINDQWAFA